MKHRKCAMCFKIGHQPEMLYRFKRHSFARNDGGWAWIHTACMTPGGEYDHRDRKSKGERE